MSVVYESVPRGYEGPVNLLRSLPHPPKKAYVRFFNATNTAVTVKWIDFDGRLKDYRILRNNEFFDCNTFVDHAWVFRDHKMHDPMCVANKEVFWPSPEFGMVEGTLVPMRAVVTIHRPMLSLLTLAARAVRNKLRNLFEPFFLEIPFHLQTLLVKLLLEYWDAGPDLYPPALMPAPVDPEIVNLRRDFDDFQCNILFISNHLSIHAKKLLSLARKAKSNGGAALTLIGVLEAIIRVLGHDQQDDEMLMHSRKLAPVIWKQMIFLRIHLDTLQSCCALDPACQDRLTSSYDNLLHVVARRRSLILPAHRDSVQRYHWEQLCLLIGHPVHKNAESLREDPAYNIPELLPLDQRTEWEWIDLRRKQLKDLTNDQVIVRYIALTFGMLRTTNRLENIFQVLCILHYHLTGKQLPEELPNENLDPPISMEVEDSFIKNPEKF